MERYPLAKLVEWAGENGVVGRKRLQKVVYFLQHAGCPFGAEYILHHYGPYSRDVADACDELVAAGLIEEASCPTPRGVQYTYRLTSEAGETAIGQTEGRLGDKAAKVAPFKPMANELLNQDLWELELGSTVLFLYEKTEDWNEALSRACDFKACPKDGESALAALALARRACSSRAS